MVCLEPLPSLIKSLLRALWQVVWLQEVKKGVGLGVAVMTIEEDPAVILATVDVIATLKT